MEASQNYGQSFGIMKKATGGIGYIQDDIGTDLIVVPVQCTGYGGIFPPVGTRVSYDIIVDALGNMKAESVQPEQISQPSLGALVAYQPQFQQSAPSIDLKSLALANVTGLVSQSSPKAPSLSEDRCSGIFQTERGSYGFIKQDSGDADLFVMPRECTAFGGVLPQLGTRVVYEVVPNGKTGKPKAQNVRPGFSGTMAKVKDSYGFIAQDSGEPDVFVMPLQCAYFGGSFPPIGTRVVYELATNTKTGKPCAEDVQPMSKPSGSTLASEFCAGHVVPPRQVSGILGLDQATSLSKMALTDGTCQEQNQADVSVSSKRQRI